MARTQRSYRDGSKICLRDNPCVVFGDGAASRDFCFIDNVVQANLLAACTPDALLTHHVFNVACGARTTLHELFAAIRERVAHLHPSAERATLGFHPPRAGDILHSFASIDRARNTLGYEPSHDMARGMDETIAWYCAAWGACTSSGPWGPRPVWGESP